MLEVLLTVIPSVIWILYRCYTLLQTPVDKLVENLNIEIPHAPTICIDSVNHQSVIIHWDIEVSEEEELIYIILVNNKEVALVNSTSCKLNNLQINKLYQIVVVAINVNNNYRSKSSPVFIETLLKSEPSSSLPNQQSSSASSSAVAIADSNTPASNCAINDLPFLKGRVEEISEKQYPSVRGKPSGSSPSISIDHALTPLQIKQIEDPNLLNNYLIKYQEELSWSLQEYESFQKSSQAEELELIESMKHYRKEFEEEFDSKSKLENNIKDIEKTKDNLSFIKSKLAAQLKSLNHTSELHQSKLDSLMLAKTKLEEKQKMLEQKEESEKAEIFKQIEKYTNEIESFKQENDKLDHEIKDLGNQKKKFDKLLIDVKPLIEVLSSDSNFNRDGTLKPNSQNILNDIFQIMPEWKSEILEELDKTNRNETEWKHVFKSEIRKYISMKQSLEIAKLNKNKNYQIPASHSKLNEYQVSLEFGGYSNALPKSNHMHKHNKNPKSQAAHANNKNDGNSGGWHNFYSQVYSNDSNEAVSSVGQPALSNAASNFSSIPLGHSGTDVSLAQNMGNTMSMDEFRSRSPVPYDDDYSQQVVVNRIDSPLQQVRLDHNLDSIPLQDSTSNLQPSLSADNYNYQYQPLAAATSNHVWNSPTANNNVSLATSVNNSGNQQYVGLNALGYDSNHQLPVTSASLMNNGASNSGVLQGNNGSLGGFGELFQSSLNQSGTSFHGGETQLGLANPIRSTVFSQFKGLDLPQTSPTYMNYTSPSPVPAGFDGFIMSPSPGNNNLVRTESGSGVIPIPGSNLNVNVNANSNGEGALQSPSDNSHEMLHTDSLSIPGNGDGQIHSISPQLNHLGLHNLWSPQPYGHSRNISNHSQSQIWRNDENNFGTTLSDYNKRTTGQQQQSQGQSQHSQQQEPNLH